MKFSPALLVAVVALVQVISGEVASRAPVLHIKVNVVHKTAAPSDSQPVQLPPASVPDDLVPPLPAKNKTSDESIPTEPIPVHSDVDSDSSDTPVVLIADSVVIQRTRTAFDEYGNVIGEEEQEEGAVVVEPLM